MHVHSVILSILSYPAIGRCLGRLERYGWLCVCVYLGFRLRVMCRCGLQAAVLRGRGAPGKAVEALLLTKDARLAPFAAPAANNKIVR